MSEETTPEPANTPSSQTLEESDLFIRPIDDTPDDVIAAPTPHIIEPQTIKEALLYKFSRRSLKILEGFHPEHGFMAPVVPPLANVVRRAIDYSVLDMTILKDTLRTEAEQAEFVRKRTSKTMDSLHLVQADGFVHATDIGALEHNRLSWRPDVYFDIAEAMQLAARELDVDVIWGGCWRNINTDRDIAELHAEYIAEVASRPLRNGKKQKPFFDGPHFELR